MTGPNSPHAYSANVFDTLRLNTRCAKRTREKERTGKEQITKEQSLSRISMKSNGSNISFKRIGVPPTKSTNLSVRITLFSSKTSGSNAKAMVLITESIESAENQTSAELRIEITVRATFKSAEK